MNRKIALLLTLILLVSVTIFPAGAAQQTYQETETICTEFGNIEKVSVLTVYGSPARSNTKSADRTDTYKYNGTVICTVTLSVTFGYDGKTAWVIDASASHTTYDGWSYSNEKISTSGGTATLTAKLSKGLLGSSSVNTSLTCSPTGQIS